MNGQKIFELMLDGAYQTTDDKLFHPSFKKGWRKCTFGNISFQAALRKLEQAGKKYDFKNGKWFVI